MRRDSTGVMAKQFLPVFQADTCRPQPHTEGMSKVVNPDIFETCGIPGLLPCLIVDS
jgi:hypothetical protein